MKSLDRWVRTIIYLTLVFGSTYFTLCLGISRGSQNSVSADNTRAISIMIMRGASGGQSPVAGTLPVIRFRSAFRGFDFLFNTL